MTRRRASVCEQQGGNRNDEHACYATPPCLLALGALVNTASQMWCTPNA